MFELSVFLKDKLVARSTFDAEEVKIGRSPDNEIQIENTNFARFHASIERHKDFYVVKDFGSENGTTVNGERIAGRRPLSNGDQITIGRFRLIFHSDMSGSVVLRAGDGETGIAPVNDNAPTPHVGYLLPLGVEGKPKPRPLDKDVLAVGHGERCEIVLPGKGPDRVALVIRAWSGFQLVALDPRVSRNRAMIWAPTPLLPGDVIEFGPESLYKFEATRVDAP